MILSFSVENYGPIKNKVTLDFTCGCYKEHLDTTAPFGDNRYSKMISMFGPNASGKSSFITALQILRDMLMFENGILGDGRLPFHPFVFTDDPKGETTFDIAFTKTKILFEYSLSYCMNSITKESLYYSPNGRRTLIFARKENRYQFRSFEDELSSLPTKNRSNKPFLRTAAAFNCALAKKAFDFLVNDIVVAEENEKFYLGPEERLDDLVKLNLERDPDYKRFVLAFIGAADIGLHDIHVSKNIYYNPRLPTSTFNSPYQVSFDHQIGAKNFDLLLEDESEGTRNLFVLAAIFYKAFRQNKVLVFDELDSSIHPTLLKMLVQSFASSSSPESQLIFTTHNTSIMCDELFRRDQIWFFDKNDDGETDLFSLADFKARPTDNYERDYLLGRYGAVPAVITFLKEDSPK
jgi:hypothetical protein